LKRKTTYLLLLLAGSCLGLYIQHDGFWIIPIGFVVAYYLRAAIVFFDNWLDEKYNL
jgi:hypothetical protein